MGPPPDGFATNFVQHEKMLHRLFRRHMGDAIELCLDEMRRRGESFDGDLRFHVRAKPRAGFRLGFSLSGITASATTERPDAGHKELPPDVYQCMWDTIEAMEVALPVTAAPLLAVTKEPELFVDWEVREAGPIGEVEVIDAGLPGTKQPSEALVGPDQGSAD